MIDLFFDIETVPNFVSSEEYFGTKKMIEDNQLTKNSEQKELFWKYHLGALNPFDGKVILLTYKIDDAHTFFLKEWELGEERLLQEFLGVIKNLERGSTTKEHLKIIGQNIRGFDLIFIFERLKQYYPENERWLYYHLIKKPEILDFIQMHVPLNNFKIKGLNHDVLSHAYDFQTTTTHPSELALQYYMKEFDKILAYASSRFIYPELYKKIQKDGLISKETLQHSIQFIQSQKDSQIVSVG
jgi:hypothetical protein